MKPTAPKCPTHIGRPMQRVGEISRDAWAGKKKVLGFRYRCSVPGCPMCETILIDDAYPKPDDGKRESNFM